MIISYLLVDDYEQCDMQTKFISGLQCSIININGIIYKG